MTTSEGSAVTNDLDAAISLFADDQRRQGTSPETATAFESACRRFQSWLEVKGGPSRMDQITLGHVEAWEADLRRTLAHDAFHDNHRGVQQFLTWYGRWRDPDWRSRSAWRRAAVDAAG